MGKPTGFLEQARLTRSRRPAALRIADQREIYEPPSEEQLRAQASRCMDCGVPFCHQGCPLGNLIPDWNDLVYRGRHREAAESLLSTNDFPEFTGRLCPAPCEASCVLAINDQPVTIKEVEVAIIDRAFAEGWVVPREPRARTGKRACVIGSGPAGLACAQQLVRAGHDVVVLEKSDRVGGLLRYGIPDFKMDKAVLERRLDVMRAEGVNFRTGVEVGRDLRAAELVREFDAICIATGALEPRVLDVEGAALPGVMLAMPYLEQQNRINAGDAIPDAARVTAAGKHVIILGGGDTGADCLGTAHRQGARGVVQLEIAPRPPDARHAGDPWPLWPNVFRVSGAHEEGGERAFSLRTTRLEADERGHVTRLIAEVVRPTAEGFIKVDGEGEVVLPAGLVLIATGYTGPEKSSLYAELGVALDAHGRVAADDEGRTSAPRVFAAGDARRGASLIVWAIAEGRRAARSIDTMLREALRAELAPASTSRPSALPVSRPPTS